MDRRKVGTADREAEKRKVLTAIRRITVGREGLVIDLLPALAKELVSKLGKVGASTGHTCPICNNGILHYMTGEGDKTILLKGYSNRGRSLAAKVLEALRQAKENGQLLGMVERSIGEKIPTLEEIQVTKVPAYICTNPNCNGIVFHLLSGDHEVREEAINSVNPR
jgi:hypothetical protein